MLQHTAVPAAKRKKQLATAALLRLIEPVKFDATTLAIQYGCRAADMVLEQLQQLDTVGITLTTCWCAVGGCGTGCDVRTRQIG